MALALISLFHPSSNAMILGESIVEASAGLLTGSALRRFRAARVSQGARRGGAVALARRRRAACGALRLYLY